MTRDELKVRSEHKFGMDFLEDVMVTQRAQIAKPLQEREHVTCSTLKNIFLCKCQFFIKNHVAVVITNHSGHVIDWSFLPRVCKDPVKGTTGLDGKGLKGL